MDSAGGNPEPRQTLSCSSSRRWAKERPLAIMEAMKPETPVIASRVGGVPEMLADGDARQPVTPGSIGDIREAIGQYLSDPELTERHTKRTLTRVREGVRDRECN